MKDDELLENEELENENQGSIIPDDFESDSAMSIDFDNTMQINEASLPDFEIDVEPPTDTIETDDEDKD